MATERVEDFMPIELREHLIFKHCIDPRSLGWPGMPREPRAQVADANRESETRELRDAADPVLAKGSRSRICVVGKPSGKGPKTESTRGACSRFLSTLATADWRDFRPPGHLSFRETLLALAIATLAVVGGRFWLLYGCPVISRFF